MSAGCSLQSCTARTPLTAGSDWQRLVASVKTIKNGSAGWFLYTFRNDTLEGCQKRTDGVASAIQIALLMERRQ